VSSYESSLSDRFAYQQWLNWVGSGKSLFQLQAMKEAATPEIRASWVPSTFTPHRIGNEEFDALVCNLSYHFFKHGEHFGTVKRFTDAALLYFRENRAQAEVTPEGHLLLPKGRYTRTGQIISYWPTTREPLGQPPPSITDEYLKKKKK
jgi:hypothetical protein